MVNRTKPRANTLRQQVPWQVYDAINRRTCLHVDAWLYQTPDDTLYFIIRYSAGGHDVLALDTYRAEPGALVPVHGGAGVTDDGLARYIGGGWSERSAPWLSALYWRAVYPLLHAPRAGFKGPRSIVLHFVYSDTKVTEPTAGVYNMYETTGRAGRYGNATEYASGPVVHDGPHWSAPERSLLRTLNKLIVN